jgi:hypothetical protein
MLVRGKKSLVICILFSCFVIIGNNVYLQRSLRNESLKCIAWDTYGYYLYLPAIIIHHDPFLKGDWPEKLNEKYSPTATFYQVTEKKNDKRAIIYNIGYSICYLPAFLIGHTVAIIAGYDVDGMSPPYQISLLVLALVYNILGIFFLRKLLLLYFQDSVATLSLIVIYFGTNLYMSAGLSLCMPHNLLFLTNCLYLIYVGKWFDKYQTKDALIAGLILGMNTITRPTELTLIVVPLLWGVTNFNLFPKQFTFFWEYRKQVMIFISCVVGCILLQFSYWFLATDSFQFNFHAQRLYVLDPNMFKFLFSYKKGWLLYTPLMTIGLLSHYYIYKRNKKIFWSFATYTFLIIYALSSWECWWYAASFGQRPMIESYPFFAISFGYFFIAIGQFKILQKTAIYAVLLFFIALNIFQTWQFSEGIIDPERMTKKYYWEVFGKTKTTEENKKYLSIDRGVYLKKEFDEDSMLYNKKEIYRNSYEDNSDTNIVSSFVSHSGSKSIKLNLKNVFSPTFTKKYHDITSKEYLWVRASVWVYINDSIVTEKNNAALVVYMDSRGMTTQYSAKELLPLNIKPKVWTQVHLDYLTPEIKHSDDALVINIWNIRGGEIFIDDLKIEALEPINDFK